MSYYVVYNPELNNAIVGLSEEPIVVEPPLRQKGFSGDMPDMSRMEYNPSTIGFYAKPVRLLTKLQYLRRFTQQERINIRNAASASPELYDYMALLDLAEEIDLSDPDTIAAVTMLEMAGLIAEGRAAEILA